jgi:hypothetical protein
MTARVMIDIMRETARAESIHAKDYPDGTRAELTPLANNLRLLAQAKEDVGAVTWADVLAEETAEAISEEDPDKLRAELVQVASVATRWIASLDRRNGAPGATPAPTPGPTAPARPSAPSAPS